MKRLVELQALLWVLHQGVGDQRRQADLDLGLDLGLYLGLSDGRNRQAVEQGAMVERRREALNAAALLRARLDRGDEQEHGAGRRPDWARHGAAAAARPE